MAWIFHFDRSDDRLRIRKGADNLWRWQIANEDGDVIAIPVVRDAHTSFEDAYADAKNFLDGLGADYRDLTLEDKEEKR